MMGFVVQISGVRPGRRRRTSTCVSVVDGAWPSTKRQRPQWQEVDDAGTLVVQPPGDVAARCIVHFLGGTAVGVTPRLAYPELINLLAESGYLVIVTPYQLSLDYLYVVDQCVGAFERGLAELDPAQRTLPVVGVGHSLGALLHVILCTLFPQRMRLANVLISYNNKSTADAIPGFDRICGVATFLGPSFFDSVEGPDTSITWLLTSLLQFSEGLPVLGAAVPPVLNESIGFVAQLRPILRELAEGTREFKPSPEDIEIAAARGYDVLHTLVVKFKVDTLDESEKAERVLRERTDLESVLLDGTHTSPLQRDPITWDFELPVDMLAEILRERKIGEVRTLHQKIADFLDPLLPS